jgi:tetratricopeptide (TPR) repeat protein
MVKYIIKKAVCLIFSEQNDSAIIYFERSADLEYKKADSFYNIGMMYYHLGSDSLSLVYLDKVLSISPNDSFALNIKEKLLDRTNGQKNEGHSKFDFSSL